MVECEYCGTLLDDDGNHIDKYMDLKCKGERI